MNSLTYTILDYAGVKGNSRTLTITDKRIICSLLAIRDPEREIGCVIHIPPPLTQNSWAEKEQIMYVFEDDIRKTDVSVEDSGAAKYFDVGSEESCLFARIHSWDESLSHIDFEKLIGKRVRVTIEICPTMRADELGRA